MWTTLKSRTSSHIATPSTRRTKRWAPECTGPGACSETVGASAYRGQQRRQPRLPDIAWSTAWCSMPRSCRSTRRRRRRNFAPASTTCWRDQCLWSWRRCRPTRRSRSFRTTSRIWGTRRRWATLRTMRSRSTAPLSLTSTTARTRSSLPSTGCRMPRELLPLPAQTARAWTSRSSMTARSKFPTSSSGTLRIPSTRSSSLRPLQTSTASGSTPRTPTFLLRVSRQARCSSTTSAQRKIRRRRRRREEWQRMDRKRAWASRTR
mmetsp:Transcript_8813/g.20036  ORF Transcript_8813/g.20036 Transcript_8813/m.20036 type:complete len:263 (+) Transcript_8813:744-1532(+)